MHLNKLRRAEGGAKFFWAFRVKNHDFTPKNHIFSNFRGGGGTGYAPLDPLLGIHLDFEDMIYYVLYKKLLIYIVYAFLLRFPSLFQNIMLPNLKISLALLLFLQLLVVLFLM